MFADRAKIYVRSGKGGDGHVSFRREKYVPSGGPDGGDGGHGGDVIFVVDEGLNTLIDFRHIRKYKAGDGEEGGKKNCRGKDGEDIIIKVPAGTVIKEAQSGQVITDMSGDNKRVVLLKGGKGGNGNQHYATSTMQAPKYAQPGQPAQELWVQLELKVIADVGLVGFPNVGKSTLLSRVSNARPKIANYHFTTLNPHLGVVDLQDGQGFVMADIPGLIEGASQGIGLGHDFLRHIERTKVLVHVVDAASVEGRDPVEDIRTINAELKAYNPSLLERPQVIAANKVDSIYNTGEEDWEDPVERLKREFEPEGIQVFAISAVTGQGVKELLYHVNDLLKTVDRKPVIFEKEFEYQYQGENLPYTVERNEDGIYVVEGPKIEKMLGYTNLDSEKGFQFFQKFLKDSGILAELEEAAKPFHLRIEGPMDAGEREKQMLCLKGLREEVDRRGINVELVADEWCNTLEDVIYFCDNKAGHMAQIKTPDLGGINNTIEAVLYCKEHGFGAYQGGTCNETDRSCQVCVDCAMATKPDQILAKPGMGVDEGFMIVYNEMNRVLALRNAKKC